MISPKFGGWVVFKPRQSASWWRQRELNEDYESDVRGTRERAAEARAVARAKRFERRRNRGYRPRHVRASV